MTLLYPIYVRRSDGKAATATRGKREEHNRPTEDQMNQKPDTNGVSDYYREVQPDEAKHIDWRRKLGGMLARELQRRDQGTPMNYQCHAFSLTITDIGHILVQFPEHYRLFEHIKRSEKDGKTEVKNKTHAAGGNDRQDAYLYGHPDGRRKRFRSPADYFPHLLWLCTDETGDPDNCSCKLCCPEEFEGVQPVAKAVKAKIEVEKKLKPQNSDISVQAQPQSQSQPQQSTESLQPTPLPRIRSMEQQIDSQYRGFKYRPGELCWFRRENAWGLGVVLRRWVNHSQQSYTVQPLSHPFERLDPVIKSHDGEMRPWLAWSVPKFTLPALNELDDPPRFETVNWQALRSGNYGEGGNLEVDGSILAAKSIDSSYTPFNAQSTKEGQNGQLETYYDGIYLGGEKVWVGEPIRLAYGSGTDIMVVQSIVEGDGLSFVGDTYSLMTVPHPDASKPTPATATMNPQLPTRLTEDLAFRNAFSTPQLKRASFWKLTAVKQRVGIDAIKGRWYEASSLLPDLHSEQFETMKKRGDIQEASLFLNARGDCLSANRSNLKPKPQRIDMRRQTRIEAFANAVPPDTQIVEGIDPPSEAGTGVEARGDVDLMIDPQFATQNGDDGSLDQFMNLDGVDQSYQQY